MFSADAKEEIARVHGEKACCPAAFVRALARFSRGDVTTIVATERGAIARAALGAARAAGIDAVSTRTPARLRGHALFVVRSARPAEGSGLLPSRACCRRAWLRGAFLACGSVADPARGYHLEFFARDDASARMLCDVLASHGIDASVGRRRGRPLAYVKGAQSIADALGAMGASQAVFALDDLRARRQTKNDIRRRVNAEAANAVRTATSGVRQRDAALRAIRSVGLGRLSAPLAQAAQLRIAHPESTLAELAARARPPVTKPTMSYRLRALERLGGRTNGAPTASSRPTSHRRKGGPAGQR